MTKRNVKVSAREVEAATARPSNAQTQSSVPMIGMSQTLFAAIFQHLKNGGTRLEADMLAENMVTAANAANAEQQRANELRDAKQAAVEEYKASLKPAKDEAVKPEADAGNE